MKHVGETIFLTYVVFCARDHSHQVLLNKNTDSKFF